jgi:hypothetical protein
MKRLLLTVMMAFVLTACQKSARVVSENLSQAADNFEINRRVVFYNSFNGEYMLTIEGLCSLDAENPRKIAITCRTGPSTYKKHFLGLSDNVTYFIEQMEPAKANAYYYRVNFKPSTILPDIRIDLP